MRKLFSTIAGAVLALTLTFAGARAAEVTIGYQQIYNPWKVAIANGDFEKAHRLQDQLEEV